MTRRNILFLCTGNSARSIIAEALLNHRGHDRFQAFSAGSHPTRTVNPLALEVLAANGVPIDNLRSKSWDEFAARDAPRMDLVVTVCDRAAQETCPIWPGHPATAHLGFADPASVSGSTDEKRQAFERVFSEIDAHIRKLISLPPESPNLADALH